jgi:hypothetical protein
VRQGVVRRGLVQPAGRQRALRIGAEHPESGEKHILDDVERELLVADEAPDVASQLDLVLADEPLDSRFGLEYRVNAKDENAVHSGSRGEGLLW